MLVLSRRLNERIVIPSIEATIEVVALKPGAVRLGFRAPAHVRFLREEMGGVRAPAEAAPAPAPPASAPEPASRREHLLRNQLGNLGLGLTLMRRQVEAGQTAAVQLTLDRVEHELQALLDHLGSEKPVEPETAAVSSRITASCSLAAI
jgi:carbon storage regulator CsrA